MKINVKKYRKVKINVKKTIKIILKKFTVNEINFFEKFQKNYKFLFYFVRAILNEGARAN